MLRVWFLALAAVALQGCAGPGEDVDGPVRLVVQRVPPGSDAGNVSGVVNLSRDDVDAFPAPARDAWRRAAAEGTANFTLPRADAESMTATLKALGATQGIAAPQYYRFEGALYSMSGRTSVDPA